MSPPGTTDEVSDPFGLVGAELEARYRVERVVAEGGFGVVYAGYDQRLKVRVALKVLKPDEAMSEPRRAAFAAQFVREAWTVARLRHPAIVAVQNLGVVETPSGVEVPWMALEWLDGRTLHEALRARTGGGGLSPREALALLRPVLDAVAHAHEEGFAHRDLKPANIMLVPTRRGDAPFVLDFGVAKAVACDERATAGETSTEGAVGGFTAAYAAPEQVSGTRTGPWTDVHALGLIFVELLVGRRPYEGADRAALFTRALAERRPTPARFGVDVGPLEPVLARAVALRPDARFASARELLDALEAAVAGATEVSAVPAPVTTPAAAPGRAWALAAVGVTVAAGVLFAGFGGAARHSASDVPSVQAPGSTPAAEPRSSATLDPPLVARTTAAVATPIPPSSVRRDDAAPPDSEPPPPRPLARHRPTTSERPPEVVAPPPPDVTASPASVTAPSIAAPADDPALAPDAAPSRRPIDTVL